MFDLLDPLNTVRREDGRSVKRDLTIDANYIHASKFNTFPLILDLFGLRLKKL